MQNFIANIIATFFYVGYLPFIPGTFGSLAGLAVYYFIKNNISLYILAVLILTVLGIFAAGQAEKIYKTKDPKYVVVDEVVGMLLSLMFLPNLSAPYVVMAFFVFRLLDTLKPYPIGLIERLKGSAGIMGDDIVAGIYANLILQTVLRVVSFTAS